MGKLLTKAASRIKDLLRKNLRVVEAPQLVSALKLFMGRQGLVLTPKPWVVCTCPQTRAAAEKAACRTSQRIDHQASGPNFAGAGPTVCPHCPYSLTLQNSERTVTDEALHLARAAKDSSRAGTLFGEIERERLLDIQRIARSHYSGLAPTKLGSEGAETGYEQQ
jgi:hypothetical protein